MAAKNLVTEIIDERILRLLGLQDIFDLDYGTYKTLLKEALVAAQMTKSKIPVEEAELLRNEFKRVRNKTGRFKPKSKKINVGNVSTLKTTKKTDKSQKQKVVPQNKLLPQAPEKKKSEEKVQSKKEDSNKKEQQSLYKLFEDIKKGLQSIASSVKEQNKILNNSFNSDRKRSENERRRQKEEGLEKGGLGGALKGVAKTLIAPFQNIFDRIFKFLFWTLLGKAFFKLMNWMGNPANQKKVESLTRFVKDWFPAILTGFLAFCTPLGGFVATIVGTLGRGLIALATMNPALTAVIGTGVLAAWAGSSWGDRVEKQDKEFKELKPDYGEKPSPQKSFLDYASSGGLGGQLFNSGGKIKNIPASSLFASGGNIHRNSGIRITGAGPDTQLIAAQPGEVVMNKATVDAIGADKLLGLNALYGGSGANVPKWSDGIRLAKGGGLIGDYLNSSVRIAKPKINFEKESFDQEYLQKFKDGGPVKPQSLNNKQPQSKNNWWEKASQFGRGVLKAVSRPLQGIKGKGLGGTIRKGYHGTSKEAASSIRQANLYKDWQQKGLGFRSGSPQNIYMTRNAFMTPDLPVAQRFATSSTSAGRGMLERGLNRGIAGTGDIIDVAAPMGSGSFLRLPGATEQIVKPKTLTKGMRLMNKINMGKYAKSAKAAQLLREGYTTASLKGARGLGKVAGRFAPGVGIALGAIDAGMRVKEGDWAGAGLSVLSMIPGPIGWGALALQLGYDAFLKKQDGGPLTSNQGINYNKKILKPFQFQNKQDDNLSKKFIKLLQPDKMEVGGPITTQTGEKVNKFGGDTQLLQVAVQPGEHHEIFPKQFVENGGLDEIRTKIANMDYDSMWAKKGYRNKNIGPLTNGIGGIINLPSEVIDGGPKSAFIGKLGTPKAPNVPSEPMDGDTMEFRSKIMSVYYGIGG